MEPHRDLIDNDDYKALIDEVIANKRKRMTVWGCLADYQCIRDFKKFKCYPR